MRQKSVRKMGLEKSSKVQLHKISDEIRFAIFKCRFKSIAAVMFCLLIVNLMASEALPDVSINKGIYPSYPPWTTRTSLGPKLPSYDIPLTDVIDTFERSMMNTWITVDLSNFSLRRKRNKIHHGRYHRMEPKSQTHIWLMYTGGLITAIFSFTALLVTWLYRKQLTNIENHNLEAIHIKSHNIQSCIHQRQHANVDDNHPKLFDKKANEIQSGIRNRKLSKLGNHRHTLADITTDDKRSGIYNRKHHQKLTDIKEVDRKSDIRQRKHSQSGDHHNTLIDIKADDKQSGVRNWKHSKLGNHHQKLIDIKSNHKQLGMRQKKHSKVGSHHHKPTDIKADKQSGNRQRKHFVLGNHHLKPNAIKAKDAQWDFHQIYQSEHYHTKLTNSKEDSDKMGQHKTNKLFYSSTHANSGEIDFRHAGVYLSRTIPKYDIQNKERLQFEIFRLGTFYRCSRLHTSAIKLAKYGFYCTPQDEIKCFSCDSVYKKCKTDDDVDLIHKKLSGTCRMVRCVETRNKPSSKEANHQLFNSILANFDENSYQYMCRKDTRRGNHHISEYTLEEPQGICCSSDESPELPKYKMDSEPRGIAVIINNEIFNPEPENGVKLIDRNGSRKDTDELKKLFIEMKFEVRIYQNRTAEGMTKVAFDISSIDHSKHDCLIFCIMSHGGYTYLYGTEGKHCRIKTLTDIFSSIRCKSLAGKPKLFFFQSCQGITTQPGRSLDTDSSDFTGYIPDDDKLERSLPNEADFLMSYATVPGCVSYRCPVDGSWYINSLVKNLRKYRNVHLMSVLTMVNNEVSEKTAKEDNFICKQIPMSQSSLRKLVYFS